MYGISLISCFLRFWSSNGTTAYKASKFCKSLLLGGAKAMQISKLRIGHAAKRTAAVCGKEAEALQQGVFVMSQRFFWWTKNQAKDCRVVCGLSAWTCTDCVWPREKPVSGSLPRTLNMHFSGNDLEDFQVKQPLKTIVVSWSRLILDLVVAINMLRP